MGTKHNWSRLSQDLQLGEIQPDKLPRLLLDCILDLQKSQEEIGRLKEGIVSTIHQQEVLIGISN